VIVVLGFDGLGRKWVEEYKLKAIKQEEYTTTDLSDYRGEHPYTPVVWSSMISGEVDREMEEVFLEHARGNKYIRPLMDFAKRVLPLGVRRRLGYLWNGVRGRNAGPPMAQTCNWYKKRGKDTIFEKVENSEVIKTIPGYNGVPRHERRMKIVRRALSGDESKIPSYDKDIIDEYKERKEELLNLLDSANLKLVFFYTNFIDALGHLHFANPARRMKWHFDVNELTNKVREKLTNGDILYIISDHGMVVEDGYGSHSHHGFFSSSNGDLIEKPTDLYHLLRKRLGADEPPDRRTLMGIDKGPI